MNENYSANDATGLTDEARDLIVSVEAGTATLATNFTPAYERLVAARQWASGDAEHNRVDAMTRRLLSAVAQTYK